MSQPNSNATSLGVLTAIVPFTSTLVAMLFGMLIGGTVGWYAHEERSLRGNLATASLADLATACEPVVEDQRNRLAEIRDQLVGLEGTVVAREREVEDLRAQLSTPNITPEATAELEAALSNAREGLAQARLEVATLRRTKDQLVDRLAATQARLDETASDLEAEAAIREALQSERSSLVEEAITQRWFRMITEAQLDICERAGKRKIEACRSSVVEELASVRREFVHCLQSDQAAPAVHRVGRDGRVPSHSRRLDADNRFLEGWYVQLCDPTLPERTAPVVEANLRDPNDGSASR